MGEQVGSRFQSAVQGGCLGRGCRSEGKGRSQAQAGTAHVGCPLSPRRAVHTGTSLTLVDRMCCPEGTLMGRFKPRTYSSGAGQGVVPHREPQGGRCCVLPTRDKRVPPCPLHILNPHICCAHTLQVPEVAASPRTMDWGHGQGFAITGLGTVWRACRGPGSGGLSFSWEIVLFSWKQTSPHTHSQ